jgi:hypothetical protein
MKTSRASNFGLQGAAIANPNGRHLCHSKIFRNACKKAPPVAKLQRDTDTGAIADSILLVEP